MTMTVKRLIGRKAKDARREKISSLISTVKGIKGWRESFYSKYPEFNNDEGVRLIGRALNGICDDPDFLVILEEFIPWVEETQPEWFTKKKSQENTKS